MFQIPISTTDTAVLMTWTDLALIGLSAAEALVMDQAMNANTRARSWVFGSAGILIFAAAIFLMISAQCPSCRI